MKKLFVAALVLATALVFGAGVASAAGPDSGSMGISVGMGNSVFGDTGLVRIAGKYFIDKDLALLAGFGFQTTSGDVDADIFSFQVGARKYFGTGELAPFVGGRISYETFEDTTDPANPEDQDAIDILAEFGAEYFLGKQFSFEGSVGLGFGTVDDNAAGTDYTYMGTRTVGVAANFYF